MQNSKKGKFVYFTMKAEYMAAKEALWFTNFLLALDMVPNIPRYLTVYCDNTGNVVNLKEARAYKAVNDIKRKYHLIHRIVGRGEIVVDEIAFLIQLYNS